MKICTKCGILKSVDGFYKNRNTKDGLQHHCKECIKEYHQNNSERIREYYHNNLEKRKKQAKENRKRQGYQTMYENKSCPQYLGVVIGERLCKHLFKNVSLMPNNHSGYDIVCGKGFKIDVKAACVTTIRNKYSRWRFAIRNNKIADFFILVAFDNIEDLNPVHLFMIPGKELNEKSTTSITFSTIHKWDKWKMDINDAQMCCNKMKGV